MFKKLFDFLLFTNRLSVTAIAREADIERRNLERLLPKSGYNTSDTYTRSRQTTRSTSGGLDTLQQYGSINKIINQYLDEDYAVELGNAGLEFNKDDFIRLGRRSRRATRDNKDKLVIAGGLGKETQRKETQCKETQRKETQ